MKPDTHMTDIDRLVAIAQDEQEAQWEALRKQVTYPDRAPDPRLATLAEVMFGMGYKAALAVLAQSILNGDADAPVH